MNGSSVRKLGSTLGKHHPFIFTMAVLFAMIGAVFSLYQIITDILAKPIEPNTSITSFDQATVDKIKKLQVSNDKTIDVEFPSPRANPFVED